MKRLSATQATRCEEGKQSRCRCRCGGLYHGSHRSLLPEYFEQLAEGDPHQTPRKSRQLLLPPPVGSEEPA